MKITPSYSLAEDAQIIDGKAIAADLRLRVAEGVAKLAAMGIKPGLAVILVGDDPASQLYVKNKSRLTSEAGMASFQLTLPAEASEQDLLALLDKLNRSLDVDGILVQLPLPRQIDAQKIIAAIDPAKDVDGFHASPAGCMGRSPMRLSSIAQH